MQTTDQQAAPIAAHGSPVVPMIEIAAATKTYVTRRGPLEALRPIDLKIMEGEFLALLGPSGCGKSTLLSMVAGLTPSTTGRISIAGKAVRGPVDTLGMVFQRDLLLDWRDALDNVLLQFEMRGRSAKPHADEALRLLASVGLSGMEHRFPFELSGGMRQRVAICRALVHEPSLLLLDEPMGALDALTRDQLRIDLQRMWATQRKTAMLVTHDIEEAVFLAERVVVMSPRPGSIHRIVTIDLPYPRRLEVRESPRFTEYVHEIREMFEQLGVIHED